MCLNCNASISGNLDDLKMSRVRYTARVEHQHVSSVHFSSVIFFSFRIIDVHNMYTGY